MELEEKFVIEAKKLIRRYLNAKGFRPPTRWATMDDIVVVWTSRNLNDWLVFMSVPQLADKRFSVTFNSIMNELLINTYTVDGYTEILDEEY
jgi:Family of unknown function (DUF6275)